MPNLIESCADLPTAAVRAGDVVIAQGQAPGPVYVLVDGEVLVERNGVVLARVATPGSVFGEMSTLLQCPATATVRASTPATLLVAEDGETFLTSQPEVTLTMARALAARLDHLSGYLAEVKRQFAGQPGHLGMLDDVLDTLLNHQPAPVRPGSARMPELDY